MKLFNLFRSPDINKELEQFDCMPQALLLDVRSPREYNEGHIPESVNIPSYEMHRIEERPISKFTPIFVYCYSGVRSRAAAQILRTMGYKDVRDIGGISAYHGQYVQGGEPMVFESRIDPAYGL